MRLNSIKLAGFKSFVDPTTISLPSNLVAVVGPNGCGKSNIIDALRWVMGESSAKQLRGESMADVIFNGSASRKPLGQASVELHFDNSDGTIGGEYASFSDIVIRRTVDREGHSNYFLNNTRCRRKDITNIFLGTGLGPRSYSVIEQGMISQFIEAKPDELRVFLEEAAGISKYKERRRETQNRLGRTKENLEQLEDILEEITNQINHLQKQANAAEQYKTLRKDERQCKAECLALRWKSLNQQKTAQNEEISEQEILLERQMAEQQSIATHIEEQRQSQTELTDAFNEVQSRFYATGADIARREQSIEHQKERLAQLEQDAIDTNAQYQQVEQQSAIDQSEIRQLEEEVAVLKPQIDTVTHSLEETHQNVNRADETMHAWQIEWDAFNEASVSPSQQAQVEETRIKHLEQQLNELQTRIQGMMTEINAIEGDDKTQALAQLSQLKSSAEETFNQQREILSELSSTLQALEVQFDDINQETQASHQTLHQLQAQHASADALQQVALGKENKAIIPWLEKQGLLDKPRLAEKLSVESGWEQAVETVLGPHLEAVCVDHINPIAELIPELVEGDLNLFITHPISQGSHQNNESLLSKVSAPWSLEHLLKDVYITDDLPDALRKLPQLAAHESIITRNGIWLGQGWLRVSKGVNEKHGIIQREQTLKELAEQIQNNERRLNELENTQQTLKTELNHTQDKKELCQLRLAKLNKEVADHSANHQVLQAEMTSQQERSEQITYDWAQLRDNEAHTKSEITTANQSWQEALAGMETNASRRDELMAMREKYRSELNEAREHLQTIQNEHQQMSIRYQSAHVKQQSKQDQLGRLQRQLDSLSEKRDQIKEALSKANMPIDDMSLELESLLEKRLSIESELDQARKSLEDADAQLREYEKQRNRAEEMAQALRTRLEKLRMDRQAFEVRASTLSEQLEELEFDIDAVIADLSEEAEEKAWEDKLAALERKIQRLGPINMAAIDEFKANSERKEYLAQQYDDLVNALEILETAIHKIDSETRERFKETYNIVKDNFKELFPKLFGGGHAYLELTGDDLLNAGVTVMAKPPGKNNSSIHALSGGEKALTALSLVFAIFHLNPAPFCLLDEVDAPLDDANVLRYCNLVKQIAKKTQVVFISHNKIAIEMAEHMAGITMREPGVSRLVAVELHEAVAMAE